MLIQPECYRLLRRGERLLFTDCFGTREEGRLLYAYAFLSTAYILGWGDPAWVPFRCGYEPAHERWTETGEKVFSVHLEAGRFAIARLP